MRGGVVAAGVILMIIGAILFFDYPITNTGNSGANPFADVFIGPILGFIGFILLIAGLAASPTQAPTVVYQTGAPPTYSSPSPQSWPSPVPQSASPLAAPNPQSSSASPVPPPAGSGDSGGFCPYCGKKTVSGYRFCRSCGRALDEAE